MKNWCTFALAACVGLLTVTTHAQATILLPGQMVTPPSQDGVLGPGNFEMFGFTPFTFAGGLANGMYREFVSSGRTGNPFGGLSFEYQIMVNPMLTINSITVDGFAGWQTNVTFAPGGTIAPLSASRSADGNQITFTITVPPAATSMWVIVDTNAPGDTPDILTLFNQLNGITSPPLPALGPAAVPEPGTLTLALVAVPMAFAFGYRRLRRSKPVLA